MICEAKFASRIELLQDCLPSALQRRKKNRSYNLWLYSSIAQLVERRTVNP
jgi:hypothetical protein